MDHRADLFYPLKECYDRMGEAPPAISRLDGEEMPQPYRRLLVHDRDMTPTLEAVFGQPIRLRVLQQWTSGELLTRQVLLVLDREGIPVVFGAIRIHLDAFPLTAREEILQGDKPLGAILHQHRLEHQSRPQAFIRVEADGPISRALRGPTPGSLLYGRLNLLESLQKGTLAEILEILPALQEGGGQSLRIQSN
ncbi:MAG: hypothetical protein OXU26_06600 [Acidobacteriota bacterium]|nr:hypothetical protein [Acidobacteriota bacterium]MDE2963562.1 hypothetical protein [Acidobacteriota bacterium]